LNPNNYLDYTKLESEEHRLQLVLLPVWPMVLVMVLGSESVMVLVMVSELALVILLPFHKNE